MRRNSTHLAALAAITLLGSGAAVGLATRAPIRGALPEPPAPKAASYYEGRHRAQWKNETNKRGRNR